MNDFWEQNLAFCKVRCHASSFRKMLNVPGILFYSQYLEIVDILTLKYKHESNLASKMSYVSTESKSWGINQQYKLSLSKTINIYVKTHGIRQISRLN